MSVNSINSKIEKLIEEANADVQRAVSQVRVGDILQGAMPGVIGIDAALGTGGGIHAGYRGGQELGHKYAGMILGQEGAAGARSKWDPSTSIGDVYTKENATKRAAQGVIPGLALGAVAGQGDIGAALGGAALASALNAGVRPALRYGLGKVFGGTPNTDRAVK